MRLARFQQRCLCLEVVPYLHHDPCQPEIAGVYVVADDIVPQLLAEPDGQPLVLDSLHDVSVAFHGLRQFQYEVPVCRHEAS